MPHSPRLLKHAVIYFLLKPELITRAKTELAERRAADFKYESFLGNRSPALGYRD